LALYKYEGTKITDECSARVVDLWNELDNSNVAAFKRKLGNWVIKHSMVVCSGSNTGYKSSEPLKTLVMLMQMPAHLFQIRKGAHMNLLSLIRYQSLTKGTS